MTRTGTERGKPRWYFSLRSPYSWMAYRDLTERYPDVANAVEWIPFWEPDTRTLAALAERGVELSTVPMSRAKNLYILMDTARLAKARGWTLRWPIDRQPHWEPAHLAYLPAADAGLGREFADLVYRARWNDNRDICDPAVIGDLAQQLGLDRDLLSTAADNPALRARGIDCLVRSWQDGLFGVPFFISGREKFFGVERLAIFVDTVRGQRTSAASENRSWAEARACAPDGASTGADAGHAGGCG